jgi:hypothetical protein
MFMMLIKEFSNHSSLVTADTLQNKEDLVASIYQHLKKLAKELESGITSREALLILSPNDTTFFNK